MNKIANVFESLNIGGFILGITMSDLYTIMGILSFFVSIVSGIVVIVLKVKSAMADGVIDKEELEDLTKELKEIERKVKEKK